MKNFLVQLLDDLVSTATKPAATFAEAPVKIWRAATVALALALVLVVVL
jgi:hypothetical protein